MSKPSNKICPRCGKGGYINYIGQSNIYEAKCYNCGYYFAFGELDLYEEKKPVTNADRIRQMTDEELADYLIRDVEAEAVRRSGRHLTAGEIDMAVNDCVSWLKSPVKQEGEGDV